ncbi:MAG: WD40-repeat-containing domain protein [Olpidium bornovanus]|uniref:WD40-repeat-containing domain protein n=1 Tax=Olpidium bornovanus TaxID=278681 RepID=A0A8H7ZS31_9FUNG|nr:MAG: WD40-repeat-containing domain protein [Olpidium bornovanus]
MQIWSLAYDDPVIGLAHRKQIYTLRWSPKTNGGGQRVLATASYDHTVKLWEIPGGTCLRTLMGHTDSVMALAFSPSGNLVATGGFDKDKEVRLWNAETGKLVRRHNVRAGVYEVGWNSAGDCVAASVVVIRAPS